MSRTRIKLCGFTRVEDALFAARHGADAIGLNFVAGSPRAVSIERAQEIRAALPPFVATVALFANAMPDDVAGVIRSMHPDLLQFHGDEDEPFCAQFGVPYLKAVRVGAAMTPADLLKCEAVFPSAKALLLDTFSASAYGGTGHLFDWDKIPASMRDRIVLSGGLNAGNVADAVKRIRPWAVDVSSGIETTQKGIKDSLKLRQFIEAVKNADG